MAAIGREAGGRLALVPEQHLKLVHERRPEDRLLREGDLLLVMLERGGGAGQRGAAGVAVLVALVLDSSGESRTCSSALTWCVMLPVIRASPLVLRQLCRRSAQSGPIA